MKASSTKNFFEPRARLLLQLGDKLIKNENIALLELVKNSYDADAKLVKLSLSKLDNKEQGRIEILDNGEGMDIKIIEDVWLEPGSDYKEQLRLKNVRSKKYKRLPIGEKGIGRFGVHKLGNKIELISRQKNGNEVVVIIDWIRFAQKKYLKDATFEVFQRTPEYFLRQRTGTRIIITELRSTWDKKMVRDLYKAVFTLNSPFIAKKGGDFKVEINIDDPSLIEKFPTWENIKNFALWHFYCELEGSEIKKFLYEFIPWPNMKGLTPTSYTEEDDYIKNRSTLVFKKKGTAKKEAEEVIDLNRNFRDNGNIGTIGKVTFEGYIFDRDRGTLELSSEGGRALIKQYLDEQGGIRVYRDNIRINEYGEKGNDWLNLDIRRVNIPTKRISNNIILGVIDLEHGDSSALIEKTNREGFIENEAFNYFGASILYTLDLIERLRKDDKDQIRNKISPSEKDEPVLHHLGELKGLVEEKISDESLRNKISEHLEKIENDYNTINEILLTSAGAGLTLAVGIHEVQKVIAELIVIVRDKAVPKKIQVLVNHLDDLIENYSNLLRQSDTDIENVSDILDGAIFNTEYRLIAHKIQLIKKYSTKKDIKIKCSKRLLLGAIINIIDNSIYWLERKRKKLSLKEIEFDKKIFLDVRKINESENYIELIIADNGFGFGLPTFQLTKPFISDKPDGMGLGLHIASEVMKIQEGTISFPDPIDYVLPEEFNNGALVVLKLKMSKKK